VALGWWDGIISGQEVNLRYHMCNCVKKLRSGSIVYGVGPYRIPGWAPLCSVLYRLGTSG
jgi:hypothetical protein